MSHKPARAKKVVEVIPDTSPVVYQKGKLKTPLFIKEIKWTDKQKEFINLALDKKTKIVVLDGLPGTGKSLISVYCALMLLNQKKVSDLIYIRSAIQAADGQVGYIKGSLEEKMACYNQPLQDKLEELLQKPDIQRLEKEERIVTYATSILRGYNFPAKVVLCEESQNMSLDSLVTISTRMAEFSKLFVIGDSRGQNDYGVKSGFKKYISIFNDQESVDNGVVYFKFDASDIMRSEVVRFVVEKIEAYNQKWDIK